MRGEHLTARTEALNNKGSSPHARGTPIGRITSLISGGIIPACAGNTDTTNRQANLDGDHPRMRGEHYDAVQKMVNQKGSSPHARGTRLAAAREHRLYGIIPACAGNTPEL